MEALSILTLALGAAWASGINLYATVLVLGLLGSTGLIALPAGLAVLTSPLVLGIAGVLYAIEGLCNLNFGGRAANGHS